MKDFELSTPSAGETAFAPAGFPAMRAACIALALIVIMNVIGYVDLQLFAVMAPAIKQTFVLTDTELGLLQGMAWSIGGALAFIPAGYIIDHTSRIRFILGIIVMWSLCSMLTGFSTNYVQLFFCRLGLAAAETGLAPAGFSLIADYFSPKHRSQAFLAFYAGTYLSVAGSMSLAGMLIQHIESGTMWMPFGLGELPAWRQVFALSLIPGVVLALLMSFLKEPPRHSEAGPEAPDLSIVSFLRSEGRTAVLLIFAGAIAWWGFQGLVFWMPTILHRVYGFSAGETSKAVGVVVGGSSLAGVALASLLTRLMNRKSLILSPLYVMRIGVLLSMALIPLMLLAPNSSLLIGGWLSFCVAAYVAHSVVPALLTNATPGTLRGRIFAMYNFIGIIVASYAPPAVGFVSDHILKGMFREPLLQACVAIGAGSALAAVLFSVGRGRKLLEIAERSAG